MMQVMLTHVHCILCIYHKKYQNPNPLIIIHTSIIYQTLSVAALRSLKHLQPSLSPRLRQNRILASVEASPPSLFSATPAAFLSLVQPVQTDGPRPLNPTAPPTAGALYLRLHVSIRAKTSRSPGPPGPAPRGAGSDRSKVCSRSAMRGSSVSSR